MNYGKLKNENENNIKNKETALEYTPGGRCPTSLQSEGRRVRYADSETVFPAAKRGKDTAAAPAAPAPEKFPAPQSP